MEMLRPEVATCAPELSRVFVPIICYKMPELIPRGIDSPESSRCDMADGLWIPKHDQMTLGLSGSTE